MSSGRRFAIASSRPCTAFTVAQTVLSLSTRLCPLCARSLSPSRALRLPSDPPLPPSRCRVISVVRRPYLSHSPVIQRDVCRGWQTHRRRLSQPIRQPRVNAQSRRQNQMPHRNFPTFARCALRTINPFCQHQAICSISRTLPAVFQNSSCDAAAARSIIIPHPVSVSHIFPVH